MRNYFLSLTARNADALSPKGSRRQVSLLKRKQMSPTLFNSFQRRTKVSQSSEFGHSSCKIARSFTACEVTVRILYYFPFCDFNVVLSEKCLENDVWKEEKRCVKSVKYSMRARNWRVVWIKWRKEVCAIFFDNIPPNTLNLYGKNKRFW